MLNVTTSGGLSAVHRKCHLFVDCDELLDCSGHGSCVYPGTCLCDAGWSGQNCFLYSCVDVNDIFYVWSLIVLTLCYKIPVFCLQLITFICVKCQQVPLYEIQRKYQRCRQQKRRQQRWQRRHRWLWRQRLQLLKQRRRQVQLQNITYIA